MSLGPYWCPISERGSTPPARPRLKLTAPGQHEHTRVSQGTPRSVAWLRGRKRNMNCSQEQGLKGNERMNTASTSTPLLKNKRAVIFGAGGAVGTAVAREFAAQGATVFLSGRRLATIEQVAVDIQKDGGIAHAAEVDALDEQAVNAYLDRVVQEVGSIDILLNVMGPHPNDYGNGTSTMELPLEQFLLLLSTLVPSQFITARAAARHMVRQQGGVILFVTAI
ncbi:MAG: SDR family oxidoreductase, partial [Chloroflexi bacterium]